MADERFMRHHYGASGYVEPGALTQREEKIARVQRMCTEEFCNISIADKEAIREVLHLMYDAVAANTAEFEGHKLTIADHRKEMERLTEALRWAIAEKRKEQEENNSLRSLLESARALDNFAWSAVTCDCPEATEYLRGLIQNLRGALARLNVAGGVT